MSEDFNKYDPDDHFGDAELFMDAEGNLVSKDDMEAIASIDKLEKENAELERSIAALDRNKELSDEYEKRSQHQAVEPAGQNVPVQGYPNINVNIQNPAAPQYVPPRRGSFVGGFFRFVFGFIFWSIVLTFLLSLLSR